MIWSKKNSMKYLLYLMVAGVAPLFAAVSGRVVDARGGEALARVRVRLVGTGVETSTNSDGRYRLDSTPAGAYVLQVETVGYRLVKQPVSLTAGEDQMIDVVLSPETFQRTDTVEVRSGPFDVEEGVASSAPLTLSGAEVQNLSTVLMDDPIRAVHALPGVAANNDYQSQFTLRGADFRRIGLYIDDVLMHLPFHNIANEGDASISMLNGEMVSDMLLLPIAFPARYSDRTASVLELRTREGSRSKRSVRVAAGVAATTVLVESPFAGGKGSWVASARKSYLQYLLQRVSAESGLLLGYMDVQARVGYSLTERQQVSLYVLDGVTDLDRSSLRDRSGVNALIDARNRSSLAKATWQYTPVSKVVLTATGAWLRERFDSSNRESRPIDFGSYGEWIGNGRATWQMTSAMTLEGGWSTRRMRDQGYAFRYLSNPSRVLQQDTHRGTGLRNGGYVQQSWAASRRVRLTAGARWDAHDLSAESAVSPNAAVSIGAPGGVDVHLGWGQYVQFPELALWTSPFGGSRLLPERANHFSVAVEKRLGDAARVRVEGWNRDDRDLLSRPFFDFRLLNGVIPATTGTLFNSIRGYSRGVQFVLQTRSANRLSGWTSYTLSYTRQRDALLGVRYWADEDQRHLANTYLTYRLSPSLNLSGRWAYGSGEPIPGFFTLRDGLYYLSPQKNELRLPSYQRVDFRANKSFTYDNWKLTLYGEVINVTNRRNMRFISFDGVNGVTQRAFLTTERVFPIVPVAGVTLEF
jgi:hypothetical protein